jgi:hypothetical protein
MSASGYYSQHSAWSNPGSFVEALSPLSADLYGLSRAIDAIIRHPVNASPIPFSQMQREDLLLRSAYELLNKADERGILNVASPDLALKVGGVCRDFALLAVSALRQVGIAARLRVGFANYFTSDFYEDHWACEWHHGARWHLLDVECAARPTADWEHDFSPTDVPRDRFLIASDAWAATEAGSLDAARFGVSAIDIAGQWFIAGSLLRDQAALLKIELKPWDSWGVGRVASDTPDDLVRSSIELDTIAKRLSAVSNKNGAEPPSDMDDWDRPERVMSYPFGKPLEIQLT